MRSSLDSRLRLTRLWVAVGFAVMLLNYPASRLLHTPEFHPFFDWRLYSAPPGWERADWGVPSTGLYVRDRTGEWAPISPDEAPGYTPRQYRWQLGFLASQPEDPAYRMRIRVLAQHILGPDREVQLVREMITPAQVLANEAPDTTVLSSFVTSAL